MAFKFIKIVDKLKKISPRIRILEQAGEIADQILLLEEKYSKLTDAELKNKSYRIIEKVSGGDSIDNFLTDGLAIIREVLFRTHGLKAYKVQLIGAIITHYGDFAEMVTGEGKTLVLVMVSYINAFSKKGVHIVTVNEYLVQRDSEFASLALDKLGISVGYITSDMDNDTKKQMYNKDITYAPNSELGFDYLRDNMVTNIGDKMQRPLHFAIVDEADSVLIDEARTPLIIAGSPADDISMYVQADKFVATLNEKDYVIDAESSSINLNDNGIKKAQTYFNLTNLYDVENSEIIHRVINSLKARKIMTLAKEYIVKFDEEKGEEQIALIDAFTGRILDGRMYSAGLHQAIQAKERVRIEPENVTVATVTYQSFFRLYKKLAGVSGTALTEAQEFLDIYNMVVVPIPTNKEQIREDHPDYVFGNKEIKWKYILSDIKKRHATGQPILIGTASVEDSEILHILLDKLNIPHEILNAKNHAREADIIKNAGQKNAITVATNMAGRGTDIKLGQGVIELGGLYVLGTERNESRRIDNQLRGRSGRQGDIGESRFFISLQDSLFKRFATEKFDKAQYKMGEDIIDLKFFSKLLDRTQKRVENLNYDIRKNLIDYDYVLSEQRELIYKQRDYILKTNNLLDLVSRMVNHVVEYGISIFKHPENVNMIDIDELISFFNNNFLSEENALDTNNFYKLKENELKDTLIIYFQNILKEIHDKDKNIIKDWRQILIAVIDSNWTIFLDKIQKLRDGVSLRSFEQKLPLNIYVEDSDRLFNSMTKLVAQIVLQNIIKGSNRKQPPTSFVAGPHKETIINSEFNNFEEIVSEVEKQGTNYQLNKEDKENNITINVVDDQTRMNPKPIIINNKKPKPEGTKKHIIVTLNEYLNDYNYNNRIKDWHIKSGINNSQLVCSKCKDDDNWETILLENNNHVCYFCWIKKPIKSENLIVIKKQPKINKEIKKQTPKIQNTQPKKDDSDKERRKNRNIKSKNNKFNSSNIEEYKRMLQKLED